MERAQLLHYALRYHGDYTAIRQALHINEPYDADCDVNSAVTLVDADYPKRLRELTEPPYVLFYRGEWSLIHKPCVAIVGSRRITDYATEMTQWIATHLAKQNVIVSGLAKGVDAVAHTAAIEIGSSLAVLGCGIDRVYPTENHQLFHQLRCHGLIVSEYPHTTPPLKHHFPWRNRIVAALSRCVVVTLADFKSGSMITVRHALALGRDVATIPYRIGDPEGEACNALIQEGAQMIMVDADLDLI